MDDTQQKEQRISSFKLDLKYKTLSIMTDGYNIFKYYLNETEVRISRADSINDIDQNSLDTFRDIIFSRIKSIDDSITDLSWDFKERQFTANHDRINFQNNSCGGRFDSDFSFSLSTIKNIIKSSYDFLELCERELNALKLGCKRI